MVRKFIMFAALATSVATLTVPGAALARDHDRGGWNHQDRDGDHDRRNWNRRGDRDNYGRGYYRGDNRGYYGGGGYYNSGDYYADNGYRSRDNRCRSNGTTGTIVGAIAGGLLGDAVVGRRGDGTAGAIVGAGIGALAGRAIDRNC
jgi:Ni/Co efflux regulator RcnB